MAFSSPEMATFYDNPWSKNGAKYRFKMARTSAIANQLLSFKLSNSQTLDLGCGNGRFNEVLSHFGEGAAVAFSAQTADHAYQINPHIHFGAVDINELPIPAQNLDIKISQEVLADDWDHSSFFFNGHELPKNKGILTITKPDAHTLGACNKSAREPWSNQPIENYITANKIIQITRNNWKNTSILSIIQGYGNIGLYKIFQSGLAIRIANFFRLAYHFELWRNTHLYGLHLIVIAQKN